MVQTGMPAESVWEYPRPPRLEVTDNHLEIFHRGVCVADTRHAFRVLETSHPPVFYLSPDAIRMDLLHPSARRPSFCEFKGWARYWDLHVPGEAIVREAAWSYPEPAGSFAALADHLAFYASRVDECRVEGERVQAQAGDFYGGWITSQVSGPFKGGPGSRGW